MNFTRLSAAALACGASLALAACNSSDEDSTAKSSEAPAASSAATQAAAQLPTAEELNAILAKATDPAVSIEEKTATVQGGETAPELFDTMAQSQAESGAVFEVVNPVVPGPAPDSALATVHFSTPDGQDQTADQVEFIRENDQWKLSKSWACTLVSNIVPPEQVPAMCADTAAGAAPEGAPAPAAPAAPAEDPAPAPQDGEAIPAPPEAPAAP